jgi:hypothetical protein
MGLIRRFKCVIVEGDNLLLNYDRAQHTWDLPGAQIMDPDRILSEAKKEAEKQLHCNLKLGEFLGTEDYEHGGDIVRTYLFKAYVKNVEGQPEGARLIPFSNLDKPTLHEDFARTLPLLKKKLLVKT